jgi:hypothetical protein
MFERKRSSMRRSGGPGAATGNGETAREAVKANKPQRIVDRQGNLHDLERHTNATGAVLSRVSSIG